MPGFQSSWTFFVFVATLGESLGPCRLLSTCCSYRALLSTPASVEGPSLQLVARCVDMLLYLSNLPHFLPGPSMGIIEC